MKTISPGSQASNRRYTAPSRSPRSVGSQSSLEDIHRSGKHSNSSSGSSIKIHQTRTSALRERSASKQGQLGRGVGEQNSIMRTTSISSTSSVASSRSSKSSLRPSNSTQGLKTVAEGGHSVIPVPNKRSPSSSAIELGRRFASDNSQNQPSKLKNTSVTIPINNGTPGLKYLNEQEKRTEPASTSSPSTPSKKGKKEATSKIASLWKKIEDSKKKKEKDKTNDKRIWIAKGKVIPESERALLQPHTEQQTLIDNFQKSSKQQKEQLRKSPNTQAQNDSITSNSSASNNTSNNSGRKERSRSRLSIKLSKFSRSSSLLSTKRDKSKDAPPPSPLTKNPSEQNTAPLATFDASLTSTEEDRANGNNVQEGNYGIAAPDIKVSQNVLPRHLYGEGKITWPNREHPLTDTQEDIYEDLSNANRSTSVHSSHPSTPVQPQQPSITGIYSRPSVVGLPASAIVQPFNYSPPIQQAFYDPNQPTSNMSQGGQPQHGFKMPAPPSGLPRKMSNSAIRRNDSYLGSMGRKENGLPQGNSAASNLTVKRDRVSPNKGGKTASESASNMVTLV
jgi:hypothetical protein